jgi:hypothetical protein
MTTTISSHKTAEEIYSELSLKYNNNIITWEKSCIEVGTFKECLEMETQKLYCPLLKQICQEALDKIKQDFSEVKERLQNCQKELSDYHPILQRGIIDIQKAIEIQARQDLSGLDPQLQSRAHELAETAKKHLDELQFNEQHVNLLKSRFAKRFSYDTEARWRAFMAAYNARHQELLPSPHQPGLIARLFGYGSQTSKQREDSPDESLFAEAGSSTPKSSSDELDKKDDLLQNQFDVASLENQDGNQAALHTPQTSLASKEVASSSKVTSLSCIAEEELFQSSSSNAAQLASFQGIPLQDSASSGTAVQKQVAATNAIFSSKSKNRHKGH